MNLTEKSNMKHVSNKQCIQYTAPKNDKDFIQSSDVLVIMMKSYFCYNNIVIWQTVNR